ncbi:protein DA1-like isoform X5 [Hevea brasiliensis]|uniref:protein DA1-like isoform X5 n=1 Tax=Hevea brasiliensis TaxID=3981 RepID=UPI0025E9FC4A|nr:protein DA1-like isoform X5 [Hevea brasiliensis]
MNRWLSKIFKGSNHNISDDHYQGNYGEDPNYYTPSTSGLNQAHFRRQLTKLRGCIKQHVPHMDIVVWSEQENEDIDRAIALSLLEENFGTNVINNETQLEEDEQLARALQESLNVESPPWYGYGIGNGNAYQGNVYQPIPVQFPMGYRAHPFWIQKYCPSHEHDGTLRCCSCERMEPQHTGYVALNDGRKLCLECLDSAVMDTNQCQPLYLDIQEFYESLNMRVEQKVPLLLVERQALNEAREGEKNDHYHMPETRGLCLSEEQTVSRVLRRPKFGVENQAMGMVTEPYKLTRRCEVTAILILFGLPRLLTGSILAHEMMHAWMRLKGFQHLSQYVEEGICQVLAHMWLESQLQSGSGSNVASSSASCASKWGTISTFERKLGEFFKHQIESDTSAVYGDGFRIGHQAVQKYGLQRTLDHIRMTGTFPY